MYLLNLLVFRSCCRNNVVTVAAIVSGHRRSSDSSSRKSVVLPAGAVVAFSGFVAGRKIVSGTQTRSLSTVGSAGCIVAAWNPVPCRGHSRAQHAWYSVHTVGLTARRLLTPHIQILLAREPRKCLCRGCGIKGLFDAANLVSQSSSGGPFVFKI